MSLGLGAAMGGAAEHSLKSDAMKPRSAGIRSSSGRSRNRKKSDGENGGGEKSARQLLDEAKARQDAHSARLNAPRLAREKAKKDKEWDRLTNAEKRKRLETEALSAKSLDGMTAKERVALAGSMDANEFRRSGESRSAWEAAVRERRAGIQDERNADKDAMGKAKFLMDADQSASRESRAAESHEAKTAYDALRMEQLERDDEIAKGLAGAKSENERKKYINEALKHDLENWNQSVALIQAGDIERGLQYINESVGSEGTTWERVEERGVDEFDQPVYAFIDDDSGEEKIVKGKQIKRPKATSGIDGILKQAGSKPPGVDPSKRTAPAAKPPQNPAATEKPTLPDSMAQAGYRLRKVKGGQYVALSADGKTITDLEGNVLDTRK